MPYLRFAHLNKVHVKEGDVIQSGQHIGDMGTTGFSTSSHLHFDIIKKKPSNYYYWVKGWSRQRVRDEYIPPSNYTRKGQSNVTNWHHSGWSHTQKTTEGVYHPGADINGPGSGNADMNQPVYSPVPGKVLFANRTNRKGHGFGLTVVIEETDMSENQQLTDEQWQHLAELWGHQTDDNGAWEDKEAADDWVLYYQKKSFESSKVLDTLRDLVNDPQFETSKNKVSWYDDRVREVETLTKELQECRNKGKEFKKEIEALKLQIENKGGAPCEERLAGATSLIGDLEKARKELNVNYVASQRNVQALQKKQQQCLLAKQDLERRLIAQAENHKQSKDAIKNDKVQKMSMNDIVSLLYKKIFKK